MWIRGGRTRRSNKNVIIAHVAEVRVGSNVSVSLTTSQMLLKILKASQVTYIG